MRGDKVYIVRSGRLFKVVSKDDVEDMIRVVQDPSGLPDSAYGFRDDRVRGVPAGERRELAGIAGQDPACDRQKKLSVREAVRRRVNAGDVVLRKPGYKVGRDQYLCRDEDRKRMLRRVEEAGLTAQPVAGVGYDYNFGGCLYEIGRRAQANGPAGGLVFSSLRRTRS